MTPDVYGYGFIGKGHVYELSEGRGIMGNPIFGLSILNMDGERDEYAINESGLFDSKQAAQQWVELLREEQG